MARETLSHDEWKDYFDNVSKAVSETQVYVETASMGLGNQVEMEWLPLTGLIYDSKNDFFEVATDVIDHLIYHPKEIRVDYGPSGLSDLEVIDGDGNAEIIRLKEPVVLH